MSESLSPKKTEKPTWKLMKIIKIKLQKLINNQNLCEQIKIAKLKFTGRRFHQRNKLLT